MTYKGRHRKPSTAGITATKYAVGAVVATTPMVGMTGVANAEAPQSVENAIIQCESGGNPRAQNPSSTASGLYQFINGTWRAYGGGEFAPRAKDASVAEQQIVFERAFAAEGTRPWNASRSCWQGRHGAPTVAPQSGAPRHAAPAVARNSGRAADGTGTYTCATDKLYFDACDPDNIGETVNYPRYRR